VEKVSGFATSVVRVLTRSGGAALGFRSMP
jgi:hypothetical protein